MKVAHVIDALGWGGAQKLLLTFTEAASRRGIETLVISLMPERYKTDISEMLKVKGGEVVELSCQKLYDPRTVPTLLFLMKNKRVDLVHTHLSHSNILGSIAARIVNLPVVATLHNPRAAKTGKLKLRMRLEQYCLRNLTARVIAVGENVAGVYRPLLKDETLEIIPNSVSFGEQISLKSRIALRTELAGSAGRILVLAVGSLRAVKGHHDLLTAFAQVHGRCPNAFLVIVGVGDLMESLKEYSRSLEISDHVRFLGARDDVPQLLAAADVFVNSSHSEGLSIAMLEAMAAGLPVVATSVGDAEILLATTGAGLLAEAKNPDAFAEALVRMISNPEKMRAMGQSAQKYVERNYDPESWLDKLLTCYALAQKKDDWLVYKL